MTNSKTIAGLIGPAFVAIRGRGPFKAYGRG
jgi:hypothetical protein